MDINKVFVLGVWDMFHTGHRMLITKASKLGDLTVGVVSDTAVRAQKGRNRPVYNELDRMGLIADLKYVRNVVLVDGFYIPQQYLKDYDVILIGEDQNHLTNLDSIPFIKRYNLPRCPGVSTTDIIKQIKEE